MTTLRFRLTAEEAAAVERWAGRLQIDRSEFLREALKRHLAELEADQGALAQIASWGPVEDWSDWHDASR